MLTALIALTCTLGVFQDAPATTDPAAPAPAPAPAAQTSPKVVAYLKDAEAQLYDPQGSGLHSLEFDVPVEVPGIGTLGSVHVTWAAGGQVSMDVTEADGVQLPPNLPPGAVQQMAQQSASEVVNTMLNRPISMLLESGVASLAGAEDGLVKVDFDAPEAREAGVKQQSYYFDDETVLRRSITVAETPGMMGGTMTVTAKQQFSWKPASAETPLLVPDTQSIDADMGMVTQKVTVVFSYSTIDGIVVTSAIDKTIELPEMFGGTQHQLIKVNNLVVNGKREGAPAPTGG